MFSFSNSLLQRMFRSAASHRPPSVGSQRLALKKWARNGRHNSVLTPQDLGRSGRGGAKRGGGGRGGVQRHGDAAGGGALYDGLSKLDGAVPLKDQAQVEEDEKFASMPAHGSWEWERHMIRKRAEWSIRRGKWKPPAQHFSHNNLDADDGGSKGHIFGGGDDDDEESGASQQKQQQRQQQQEPSASFAVFFPPEGATPEENQAAFDDFLERAVVLFARPHRDALRTAEMQQLLARACPKPFLPQLFGSPELVYLLRNSCYLKSHRGRWAFVRQFDPEREDVTVKLEPYRYQEAPMQDEGVRMPIPVVEERKSKAGLWS